MCVTEFESVMFAKQLQSPKAPGPMSVTEFGMVKLAKELQCEKVPALI